MAISLVDIQNVLRDEDVEGLLALGAPDDEYSKEAQDIASALSNVSHLTESGIVNVMRQIWNQYFGPFSNEDIEKRMLVFHRIAKHFLRRQ